MDLMGEREDRDANAAARSLSVVHYTERDQDAAATLVAGLIDRSTPTDGGPSFLAVLPTPDDVISFAEAVLKARRDVQRPLLPITSVARARRILGSNAAAVAGTPSDLARLVTESRLVLAHLHTLVLAWPEEMLRDAEHRASLESFLAEVPRTAERVAICAERTADLAPFLERSMWRARAIEHVVPVGASATPLRVVIAAPGERTRALRSVLDAIDPVSAVLVSFSDDSESRAREAAAVFGSSAGLLEVNRNAPVRRFGLAIILDEIPTAEALAAVSAMVDEVVAIVRPSRLAALKKVASNVTPMAWTGALASARSAHDHLRDEIRGYVASDGHSPWIPIVEPLLDGLDSVEVAAAALALLDRERRKARRVVQAPVAAPPPAPERAPREERPSRFKSSRDEERGGRAPDRGFKSKRPFGAQRDARPRSDDRRGPPRGRDDRPPRGDRPTRDRPARDDRGAGPRGRPRDEIERVPRAAHEGREWSERSERLRNSRRGPRDGGEGG
jgi:hypothetical protein